jgi:hypothetical protein
MSVLARISGERVRQRTISWFGLALLAFICATEAAGGTGPCASGGQDCGAVSEHAEVGQDLPTGRVITPNAAAGSIFGYLNPHNALAPDLTLNGAAAVAVAPDGKRLAIITSGWSSFADATGKLPPALSAEYLFLFDITAAQPRQLQALPMRTTLAGLSWAPSSDRVYASGGTDDGV